jgi:hypothetical protein
MTGITDLPPGVIAIVGKHVSFEDRNACLTAHRCFDAIHHDYIAQDRSVSDMDLFEPGAMLAALLRKKPRLSQLYVKFDPRCPYSHDKLAELGRALCSAEESLHMMKASRFVFRPCHLRFR